MGGFGHSLLLSLNILESNEDIMKVTMYTTASSLERGWGINMRNEVKFYDIHKDNQLSAYLWSVFV